AARPRPAGFLPRPPPRARPRSTARRPAARLRPRAHPGTSHGPDRPSSSRHRLRGCSARICSSNGNILRMFLRYPDYSSGFQGEFRMNDLDVTDLRILRALQDDGRMTNAELAKRSNLSPTACFERVRRLRDRGVIRGFSVVIDPASVGRGLLIFVEVVLDRTT